MTEKDEIHPPPYYVYDPDKSEEENFQNAKELYLNYAKVIGKYPNMSIEEAKSILEKSKEIVGWKDDKGILWQYKVGSFFEKYPEGFSFLVFLYSETKPLDPNYAFLYIVFRDTGEIDIRTTPLTQEEIKNHVDSMCILSTSEQG